MQDRHTHANVFFSIKNKEKKRKKEKQIPTQ